MRRVDDTDPSKLLCLRPPADPASLRLLWRAYQVVQTPNEILVDKLGLDIPPAPELILEEIQSREIHIAWKQPELPNSIHKHIVHVNGKKGLVHNAFIAMGADSLPAVGETKRPEVAIAILDLVPATLYNIRIFTVSAAGFQTPSQPLYVRTLPCPKNNVENVPRDSLPTIRAFSTKVTAVVPPLSAPGMSRELSGGQLTGRRPTAGRKQSAAGLGTEQNYTTNAEESSRSLSEDECETTFTQLQERFQKVQQDNEAAEAQILHEEKEFEAAMKQLETRRDELKQSLKERDEVSSDLKKQVHKLESANRTAQSERSKKEKLLHQRENQRKKRRDEAAKWEVQIATMTDEINGIETQKAALERRTASSVAELQQNVEDERKEIRSIEEDNNERIAQIKALEEERKRLNEDEETDESREADRLEREKDRQWQETLYNLNTTYATLANTVTHAKIELEVVRERLAFLQRARHASTNAAFSSVPPLDLDAVRQGAKQRRARQRSSLVSNISPPIGTFPNLDAFASPVPYNQTSNVSPTFSSGTTFFSSTNGMTLMGPPDAIEPTSNDVEALTGGVPMSPRADSLIPANLLGDESADELPSEDVNMQTRSSSAEGASLRVNSSGQYTLANESQTQETASPKSSSSRSASIFTSPRESLNNLADVDRRSLRSGHVSVHNTGTSVGGLSGSRNFVSGIFGFNRQRGKTIADEPPMLGALKMGESQSFPRNFGDSLDPLARRRRLSYGGNWAAPMTNLFPRNGPGSDDKESGTARLSSSRRGFPNLFSSTKLNPPTLPGLGKPPASSSGYDQFGPRNDSTEFGTGVNVRGDASSSRPSSVYSFERLPRPSTDSQPFGWGALERSNLRGSPLGPDWLASQTWSRSHSRRPSFSYGSTSNLSLQSPPEEDVYEEPKGPSRPLQAPIGTRPKSSQRPVTPKLNPAAPSFTTLFARNKDKSKEKAKSKDIEALKQGDHDLQHEDASPPESRKSKDSRSIVTAGSIADSRESLERTTSGTPSDTTPSKETFIQKITRKSSSNKFNSWKEKGGLFSRKGEPSTPGEIDEDVSSDAQLGRSLESTSTNPPGEKEKEKGSRSSLSWNFMRKSKRGEKSDLATSEVSESSERASETGDEDVHEGQPVIG